MTRKLDKYQVVNAKKPDLYPAGIVVVECLNKRRVIIKFQYGNITPEARQITKSKRIVRKVFNQSGYHDETMTQGCGHKKKTEGEGLPKY